MAAPKASSKNRVLLMAVLLILTSCGILGGAVFWAGNSLDSKAKSLPHHLEEAQALGLLTSLTELQVQIKDPAEDALPHLEAAYKLWSELTSDERAKIIQLSRRTMRGLASASDRAKLHQTLKAHPELMGHLSEAAERSACSVPEAETWRNRRLAGFWNFVRDGGRILIAEGVAHGIDGDLKAAEASFLKSAKLAAHFNVQPTYMPNVRRSGAEIELQRCIERVVFANPDKPAEMAALIERFLTLAGPMPTAADMLRGEPALMLHALSDAKRTGLENVPAGAFFADVGKAGALEIWNRYFRKLPDDPYDLNGAEAVLIAMDKEAEETQFYGRYVDGYDLVVPTLRDQLARRRLAEAAVLYLKSGQLDNLPEDPHSGNPLLVKRTAEQVTIYSVGRDGLDNDAKEREFGQKASLVYDILFRLPAKVATQTNEQS